MYNLVYNLKWVAGRESGNGFRGAYTASIFNLSALFINTRNLKFKSRLHDYVFRFRESCVITMTSNQPWKTEIHKTDRSPPITVHKPWPFEPVEVKFCFRRGSLRWLTEAKNPNVSGLFNFRVRVFLKSSVIINDEPVTDSQLQSKKNTTERFLNCWTMLVATN